jgi:hypothetical protein
MSARSAFLPTVQPAASVKKGSSPSFAALTMNGAFRFKDDAALASRSGAFGVG